MKSSTGFNEPWLDPGKAHLFEREAFEESTQLLDELEIFGWLKFRVCASGFLKPDRHADSYEVHYLKSGHVKWWVGGESFNFEPGQVLVIPPNVLHEGDEESLQPCEHYWFRIKFPPKGKRLMGLTGEESAKLHAWFKKIQPLMFPVGPDIGHYYSALLKEHRLRSSDSVLIGRSVLHALLLMIIRDHDKPSTIRSSESRGPNISYRVRKVMKILLDENIDRVNLVALAEKVGLSPTGLRARFQTETGFTPHSYQLYHRIEKAREKLRDTDDDITTIAHALGFSSGQYFATVFRRQVGISPGSYRKAAQDPESPSS